MPARTRLALLLSLFSACKAYDPLYCDENKPCSDPERPFCDLNGDYPDSEGVARTCIPDPGVDTEPDAGPSSDSGPNPEPDGAPNPIACSQPGELLECSNDTLILCNDDSLEQRVACLLGCATDELRCLDLRPSNDLAAYLDQAAVALPLQLTGTAQLNTDSGNLLDANGDQVVAHTLLLAGPVDGVPIRVVIARQVELGSLNVTGTAALAIVANEDVTINGRLSVASTRTLSGAGRRVGTLLACAGRQGTQNEVGETVHQGGNGGGGHRTAGARGGFVEGLAGGGAGGAALLNSDLIPLAGGCAGAGGGGGGAVQIVSRTRIRVAEAAVVTANGGGGNEPLPGPGDEFPPGGGGGAGGGILLEAPEIRIGGGLFANGGGGAGLCQGGGEDGREDLLQAAGASCADPDFGDGGIGGSALGLPTNGQTMAPSSSQSRVGGSGGGAAGYIRINTRYGTFVPMPTALLSPPANVGAVQTR